MGIIIIMLNFIKYYARIIKRALNTMHAQEKNLRKNYLKSLSKHI